MSWRTTCANFLSSKFKRKSKNEQQQQQPVKISTHDDPRLKRHEEGLDNYRKGGYHPVFIDEVYNRRYKIIRKLGWGHFSTVWLAEVLGSEGLHVAMKVQKSGAAYLEAAVDEIALLNAVIDGRGTHVAKLLDAFTVTGINGIHHCMVFELLGDNLLAVLKHFSRIKKELPCRYGKGIPVPVVKRITKDILIGLEFLHGQCNIIHTDLKLENVLLTMPLSELISGSDQVEGMNSSAFIVGKEERKSNEILKACGVSLDAWNEPAFAKICDLGNACWTFKHFTDYITTRQYRAPEAIVEYRYTQAVDIWSLGCVVFELITGEYLFDPRTDKDGMYSRDEDHLALMIELLGDPSIAIKRYGKASGKFFTRSGKLRNISDLLHWPLESLLRERFSMPLSVAKDLSDFLRLMLNMDPSERCAATECLQSPWLTDSNPLNMFNDFDNGLNFSNMKFNPNV